MKITYFKLSNTTVLYIKIDLLQCLSPVLSEELLERLLFVYKNSIKFLLLLL